MQEEEKTEKPSEHKLLQARKKGQVAKSADVSGFLSLLFALLGIYYFINLGLKKYINLFLNIFTNQDIILISTKALDLWLLLSLPILVLSSLGALIAGFMQFGFLFSTHSLKPQIKKINPIEGLKNLFSKKRLFELVKQIAKFVVVFLLASIFLKNNFVSLLNLINGEFSYLQVFFSVIIFDLIKQIIICFLIIAIIDFCWQRYDFLKSMGMSKYEVKKEYKQQEGDPLIKYERKRLAQETLENLSLQNVKEASVLLTNPTHLAVALKYNEESILTPIVSAKGSGLLAKEIIKQAHAYNIAIVRNVSLARSLYRLNIDEEIPENLYKAVAEVLIFVSELKNNENN